MKVATIGVGSFGKSCAAAPTPIGLKELVFVDTPANHKMAKGMATDFSYAAVLFSSTHISADLTPQTESAPIVRIRDQGGAQ